MLNCGPITTHQRFVKTTPNPKATKNRRGELLPPPPPPPDVVEDAAGAGDVGVAVPDNNVRDDEGGGLRGDWLVTAC